MLEFPNCKINLGLNVIKKRNDGFHDIESVFYPVNWCDALEIVEGGQVPFELHLSGLKVIGKQEDNIIYKAWKLLTESYILPNLQVYLHKILPMGAGLGGGSSDAAFFLKMISQQFNLKINNDELMQIAGKLGADCAFFIENKPVVASGKGNVFSEIKVNLKGYYLVIVHPGINSNTKEAYEGIIPAAPEFSVKTIIENESIENWKNLLVNDFEKSLFLKYPEIKSLKDFFYKKGAIYASMSGSGSAVYGIFREKIQLEEFHKYSVFQTEL